MKRFFSLQKLITVSIIVLILGGVFFLFQLAPYFSIVWVILKAIAVPLIISIILAYLLHPLVDFLIKFRLSRTAAIALIYLVFFGGLALLVWLGFPVMSEQLEELVKQLPAIEQQLYTYFSLIDQKLDHFPQGIHNSVEKAILGLEKKFTSWIENLFSLTGDFFNHVFVIIVIPFLVFYLLLDVEMMHKTLYLLTPSRHRKALVQLWKAIDQSLAEYIRGQIFVSLVVGSLALVIYTLIGLPYAMWLALFIGITNIIPYFGPLLGALPAVLVAFLSKPSLALWVILINVLIQLVEGNILGPWIVGKRLNIHPFMMIVVLLIGEQAGGVVGLILAVPIFVVLKVVIENVVQYVRLEREKVVWEQGESAVPKIDRMETE